MYKCNQCKQPYTPGDSYCDCGNYLGPLSDESSSTPEAPQAPDRESKDAKPEVLYHCDPEQEVEDFPGCGYIGPMPGNICPICGARWAPPVIYQPAAASPPRDGGKASRLEAQEPPAHVDQHTQPDPPRPPRGPASPPGHFTAKSDRVATPRPMAPDPPRSPEQSTDGVPRLIVEGKQTVFYQGHDVSEITFDTDVVSVGCRDIDEGIYPDVDLLRYRRAGDLSLSRRHARFIREGRNYYVEIDSTADSTTFNGRAEVLPQGARRELSVGDRVFFSDSIVIAFRR